jgi:hypothetical protein
MVGLRLGAWTCNAFGCPGLHHDTVIGVLVVADLDHEDLKSQSFWE